MCAELKKQWQLFDELLKRKDSEIIEYDAQHKTISFHKPKTDQQDEDLQDSFYQKLAMVDNIDVLRFVNERCGFLSAFTPLQPRYIKQQAEEDVLLGVIGVNKHGKLYCFSIVSSSIQGTNSCSKYR
jgi:hypothetical protein